jgi:hypothetical protein
VAENPVSTTLQEEAFLEPALKTIGDFRLRPFTVGSLPLCKKLGLTQFVGGEPAGDLDQVEQVRQVAGFLWIHCEPVEKILRTIRDPGALEDELLRYQLTIPISILPDVMAEIQRSSDLAAASAVEIVAKPSSASQESPPGN